MKNFRISRDAIYYQFIEGIDTNAARIGDTLTACKDAEGWHLLNAAGVWYFCPLATLRTQLSAALQIVRTETAPKISTEKKPDQLTTTPPTQAQKEAPKAYTPDTLKLYNELYKMLNEGREKIAADRLKNFTLEFLVTYLRDYRDACAAGSGFGLYQETQKTDLYIYDGFIYCVFLEMFNQHPAHTKIKEAEQARRAASAIRQYYTSRTPDLDRLACDLVAIFGDRETADTWKDRNADKIETIRRDCVRC